MQSDKGDYIGQAPPAPLTFGSVHVMTSTY
jgi:hypothetical protein